MARAASTSPSENVFDQTGATSLSYSADIIANGQTVYHHDTFPHSYLTRWRKVFELGQLQESR